MDLNNLITRKNSATKGDAGRVLIIAGSEQYPGAALLAGLAALRSGCDSVRIACLKEAALAINAHSPDLVTIKLPSDPRSQARILGKNASTADVILVGPGLGHSLYLSELVNRNLTAIKKKLVIDADATKIVDLSKHQRAIILANKKEYAFIKGEQGSNIIVQKGPIDIIYSQKQTKITGGHPRATVAGTGDVLAGITAALYAQLDDPEKAAIAASTIAKKIAEELGKTQGYGWIASDMFTLLPNVINQHKIYKI